VLDAQGEVAAVVGLAAGRVSGVLSIAGADPGIALDLAPNDRVSVTGGRAGDVVSRGFTPPRS